MFFVNLFLLYIGDVDDDNTIQRKKEKKKRMFYEHNLQIFTHIHIEILILLNNKYMLYFYSIIKESSLAVFRNPISVSELKQT